MTDERDPSRLRQTLRRTEQERRAHVEALLAERGPLIRGTYRLQGGRCGRRGCKCEQGQLHEKAMFYRREEGTFRCSYVPLAERGRVDELSRRYRRARNARTALSKLGKKSLAAADALLACLTEPYPPPERPRVARTRRPPKEPSS